MSREIKFRGRSIVDGEWVYGDLVGRTGYTIFSKYYIATSDEGELELNEIDRETVGQYTGLKDKNGVEIYEGDICASTYEPYHDGRLVTKTSEVKWREQRSSYYDDLIGVGFGLPYGAKEDLSNCEVVGNIYENPELLTA